MGSSRGLAIRAQTHEDERFDAELADRLGLLEVHVASLESERGRLETELSIAQSWVKELALWLDEAQLPTRAEPIPVAQGDDLEEILLSPSTVRLLREAGAVPIAWGTVALLAGLVLAPWAALGALVYVARSFAW